MTHWIDQQRYLETLELELDLSETARREADDQADHYYTLLERHAPHVLADLERIA